MTDSENKTEAKDTAKPDSADTAPYTKKDDTAETPQAGSAKNKSSAVLTISLLLAAVIIIPITIYKFNEEVSDLSTDKVAQTSTQTNVENTDITTETVTPASTDNKDTAMHSTQESVAVANNNDVTQQRRQSYENEMQSRQKKYQAMMTARQQEMAKAAETQKERYNRFKQDQLETRKEIQETQKQIHQLNEKLHYLIQKARNRH